MMISCSVAAAILLVDYFGTVATCRGDYECVEILFNVILVLYPFLPLAVLSLLTYRMHLEIFHSWITFAKWWVPIAMFLILIIPGGSGGGWGIAFPALDAVFAIYSSGLFLVISLVIIIYKYLKLKKLAK